MTRRLPFRWLLHQRVGEGTTPFPGLLHFTLDLYLIMLSVKQGGIKYHFLSLWYDSTWDWTQVSQAIGEHSNHYANVQPYCANTLVKVMNPTILSPAVGKIVGQTELLSFGMTTSLEEGKLWIQTFETPRKIIDLVSHPSQIQGLVNICIHKLNKRFGLVCLVLWHINLCRLFNAKSIFM